MVFTHLNPPPGFYVYAYIRQSNGTPYYIGKGYNKRAWSKNKRASVPEDLRFVVIVAHNLTDIGALALERRLIKWYGRKDIGTGILQNRTEGGDGAAGAKRSEQARASLSAASKIARQKYPKSSEERAKVGNLFRGKPWSAARRAAHTGKRKPTSAETARKISEAKKGKATNQGKTYKKRQMTP